MLSQTFELMLTLIHLPTMHKKIYDSKIPYMIKYFGYADIYNIGYSEADNKTSNPLSNQIMTFYLIWKYLWSKDKVIRGQWIIDRYSSFMPMTGTNKSESCNIMIIQRMANGHYSKLSYNISKIYNVLICLIGSSNIYF